MRSHRRTHPQPPGNPNPHPYRRSDRRGLVGQAANTKELSHIAAAEQRATPRPRHPEGSEATKDLAPATHIAPPPAYRAPDEGWPNNHAVRDHTRSFALAQDDKIGDSISGNPLRRTPTSPSSGAHPAPPTILAPLQSVLSVSSAEGPEQAHGRIDPSSSRGSRGGSQGTTYAASLHTSAENPASPTINHPRLIPICSICFICG